MTYTAVYEAKAKYKITWMIDGEATEEIYLEGVKPSYKGSPKKAADDEYTYEFDGWDKEIVAANADAVYTAQFKRTAKNATSNEGTTTDGKADEASKGGCASTLSVGLAVLMTVGAACVFTVRKKED